MRDRNFIWDPGTFKILGITFSTNLKEIVNLNFKDKIDETLRDISKWKKRHLTPIGKITLIKTLFISKYTYLFTNLPDPPMQLLQELDNIIHRFLWGGKVNRISKSTICKDYESGGLKMCNIFSALSAYKLSWLRRMEHLNEKEFLSFEMYPHLCKLRLFGSEYIELANRNIKNTFWRDVLKHYNTLAKSTTKLKQKNMTKLLDEPIHFNPNIKRDRKILYIQEWIDNKVLKIRDLLDENEHFIDFIAFKTKFTQIRSTNFLMYNGVIRAIKDYVHGINTNSAKLIHMNEVWDTIRRGNFQVKELIDRNDKPPTATLKWNLIFPNLKWKNVFKHCIKTTRDTQLQWFQYRILHRIIPTGRYLHLCKIVDNPICKICEIEEETIVHLLWDCTFVRTFWLELQTQLHVNCFNCSRFNLSKEIVIFGYSNNVITDRAIDFIILFAKFYIYKCKLEEKRPNFQIFLCNLRHRLIIERTVALNLTQFQLNWAPYRTFLQN